MMVLAGLRMLRTETVNAGEKVIRFGRPRPEPVIHPRAPVDGDAVGTLQQFLN
jgi:hypothetical protein